jgi:hypothetical protein
VLLAICLASALGIFAIRLIRSNLSGEFGSVGSFLIGTLPNFFGATLYTSAIFNISDRIGFLTTLGKRIAFSAGFALAGLTLWEIIQRQMGYPIDLYDIVMSALGAVLIASVIAIAAKVGIAGRTAFSPSSRDST